MDNDFNNEMPIVLISGTNEDCSKRIIVRIVKIASLWP